MKLNLQKILKESKNKVMILAFQSENLGVSYILDLYLEDIANEFNNKINIYKINQEEKHHELFDHFNISKIPSLVLLKNEKEIDQIRGIKSKEYLRDLISRWVH